MTLLHIPVSERFYVFHKILCRIFYIPNKSGFFGVVNFVLDLTDAESLVHERRSMPRGKDALRIFTPLRIIVQQYRDKNIEIKFRTCFCRQCGDDADPCSETETFSVEETLTMSTNTAATTTSTKKVLRSCILYPFIRQLNLTFETWAERERKTKKKI